MKSSLIVGLFVVVSSSSFATPIDLVNSYSQDFNTLAASGTNSALPGGWQISESGTAANATYTAGTGGSTTGDTYSFGTAGSSDRALGGLRTGSLTSTIGAAFLNANGNAMNALTVSYTGEQWRVGATGRPDRLDFQYSLDATSLITGTWVDVDELDFVSPIQAATGLRDGNNPDNRLDMSFTITGLNILAGGTFWFRWVDPDASGADDGLAIDDFSIAARTVNTSSSVPETLPFGFTGCALLGALVAGRIQIRKPSAC
jgi:hypothetical protein